MKAVFAALAALALAGSAAAADGPLTATLQAPATQSAESVAGGAVFSCKGATCVAESDTSQLDNLAICKDLARQFGTISKFGGLSSAELARCNTVARH
jgi:hypothetical protein